MLDGSHFIECSCGNDEHTIRFTIDAQDDTIYLSTFLNHYRRWYERVWVAVKYVFGYKCRYGHFDCTSLEREQVDQLKRMIAQYDELTNAKVIDVGNNQFF